MKKIKYIIDFDGTIVDVWERYYRIFIEYFKVDILKEDYKKLKKIFPYDIDLIEHLKLENSNEYYKFKKKYLEDIEYLKKDTLLIEKEKIVKIFKLSNVILLTIRNNKRNFENQLKFLGLNEIKKKIIVLQPLDKKVKKEFILKNRDLFSESIFSIGDSETDLEIGTLSFAKSYFVNTGLRNQNEVKNNYDFINLDSINQFNFNI
ncbi:HAD hydrolase-like protein [Fusobacterium varium]|uniref:HAD hydrolase-like protein n=1 Tax=Fusobacterium varium TaxID=856 RepID=UPI0022E064F4|nr:HAD hydrolase-like protein [Fusobacterium varium]